MAGERGAYLRATVANLKPGPHEMEQSTKLKSGLTWRRYLPPLTWLSHYQPVWLTGDFVAGVTLAAYAIPVALAYATLADLPPQTGIYGYLLGGLGYALLGSSRQLAVGPTSAISLMIAGTVGEMAGGDAAHYAQIASLAGFTVALLCLISWLFRLSVLVRLISDSILVGFKAGAGLTIIMTQLPSRSAFPVAATISSNVRCFYWASWGRFNISCLRSDSSRSQSCLPASVLFRGGPLPSRLLSWRSRRQPSLGYRHSASQLPAKFHKAFHRSPCRHCVCGTSMGSFRSWPVVCCWPISRAYPPHAALQRSTAMSSIRDRSSWGSARQIYLPRWDTGYPVAGGLSQSAVNDRAGARTPLALVFASLTLAVCLLFLANYLENLPKAVLAAIVFTAVLGLIDIRGLSRMWQISKPDFFAATIALTAVLLLGILQGILLAAAASVLILLARASQPHVAFLGRIPGTNSYSDLARHPENERLPHVLIFRPEASLLYVNAETVLQAVQEQLRSAGPGIRMIVCDLSASPYIDLAGSRILRLLHSEVAARGISLRIVGARGRVRDLLRADGIGEMVGGRLTTVEALVNSVA